MRNNFFPAKKIKFLFLAAALFVQIFCAFSQENQGEKKLFEQKIQWEKDENAFGYNVEIRELKTGKKYNFETEENFLNLNLSAGLYEYQVTVLNPFGRAQSQTEWNPLEILQAKTPEFVKIPEKVVVPSAKTEKFSIETEMDNVNEDTSVFLVNEKTQQKIKGTLVVKKSADGTKHAAAEFPKVEGGEWKLCAENPFGLKKESSSIEIVDQKTEEARLKAEAEKVRLAEIARIEEEKRLAEEARIAEEARKKAEAEKARLAEITRIEEEKRLAEEKRIQQEKELQARKEAEAKLAAEQAEKERLAKLQEEKRLAEEARIAEEARLKAEAEKARLAEIAKIEEEKRLAEEKRIQRDKAQVQSAEEKSVRKKAKRIFGFYIAPDCGIFYSPFFNEFSDGKVLPFAGLKIGFVPELKNPNRFGVELETNISRYSIKTSDYDYSDSFSFLKLNLLYQRRIKEKRLKLNFRAGGNLMFIQNFMDYKNSTISKKDAAYGYLGVHGGPSLVFTAGNLNLESGFDYHYEFIGGMQTDFLSPFVSVGFRW